MVLAAKYRGEKVDIFAFSRSVQRVQPSCVRQCGYWSPRLTGMRLADGQREMGGGASIVYVIPGDQGYKK